MLPTTIFYKSFCLEFKKIAALSLWTGIPSLPAVPHYFANAFQNLVAVAVATDYTFERAKDIKDLLENPEALAAALASTQPKAEAVKETAAAAPAPTKAAEPEKKEEEEEEDGGFGGLFD